MRRGGGGGGDGGRQGSGAGGGAGGGGGRGRTVLVEVVGVEHLELLPFRVHVQLGDVLLRRRLRVGRRVVAENVAAHRPRRLAALVEDERRRLPHRRVEGGAARRQRERGRLRREARHLADAVVVVVPRELGGRLGGRAAQRLPEGGGLGALRHLRRRRRALELRELRRPAVRRLAILVVRARADPHVQRLGIGAVLRGDVEHEGGARVELRRAQLAVDRARDGGAIPRRHAVQPQRRHRLLVRRQPDALAELEQPADEAGVRVGDATHRLDQVEGLVVPR